jgi:dipeptidyl aminopeptidase/acylaminoacyl peptidase
MTSGFALTDVLAAPFPSDLRLAPGGEHAAWVFNDGGCRNVWVASTGAATPARALTAYQGDDGVTIGQLCWSARGDAVLYTRGACLDDSPPPDPDGLAGAQAAPRIWLASLGQAAPRLLVPGHTPAVSPRGDLLAYVRDGQIWGLHLPEQSSGSRWVQQPGRCNSLSWSPDGTRLAFVSARGDHALVGVLDIASMAVRWLAPGPQHDMAPVWSPDSCALAFIRLADDPAPTYMARSRGKPWSIWTADVASGAVRCAWRAAAGAGSVFAPLGSGPQLLWTRCGRLVFPWEGSGWLHLYATAAEARSETPAIDLTPGPGEIFAMEEDALAGAVVCVANRDQREGRRLWRCELPGGHLSALSPGEAVTDLPSVANGIIVALQADGRLPLAPVVVGSGRSLAGSFVPPCFPLAQLATPQSVAFASMDGLPIHAQIFLPPPLADGSGHPAIIHCHGGPARQMLPAWHPTEVYSKQFGLNQYLASLGYLVLSVNYRGGTGYGLDFREPPAFGAGGASEYQDVLAARHYLRWRGDIDPQRIGIYGMSYGGLLTALALARDSALFAAGVDCAGVSDWSPAFTGAGVPETVRQTAAASSPLAAIGQWRSPVLLLHADADQVVPLEQTTMLEHALRRHGGAECQQILLRGESHDLLRHASWLRYCEATVDWFRRKLGAGGAASLPPIEQHVEESV